MNGQLSNSRGTISNSNFTNSSLSNNQSGVVRTTTAGSNRGGATGTSSNTTGTGTGTSTIGNQFNKSVGMFDVNKDGFVSLDEAFNYLITTKGRGQQISPQIFQASSQAMAITKSLDTFDQNRDLSLSDTELINALLQLRSGEYSKDIPEQIAKYVLGKLNTNLAGMDSAVTLIDSSPDRNISDLEVLNALMASRKGTVNINDPSINKVLKTNSNFDRLLAALNSYGGNFNGTLSDQEAFQIILDLRKAVVDDATISKALFLPLNSNVQAIDHSVKLFDAQADGDITDSEFVAVIMKMRHGELSTDENQIALNILNNIPKYKNIKDVIVSLDSTADGQISDDELIDFTLGSLRNHITVDDALVKLITQSDDKVALVKSLINKTDANHDGNISNQEYLAAITDLENRNLSPNSYDVLSKILSRNPNHQAIEAALLFIDQDHDSVISDTEVSKAILAKYKGDASTIAPDIFDMILASNPHKASIEAIVNAIDPNKDGQVKLSDVFNLVTKFKQGTFTADDAVLRAVLGSIPKGKEIIDTYESMDANHDNSLTLREYTAALMQMRQGTILNPGDEVIATFTSAITNASIVKDAIAIIDADNSGVVTAQEFVGNFTKAITGSNGQPDLAKLAILSPLMDIIFPGAAALDQFRKNVDINNDNIISDSELINAVFKLSAGTMTNPGQDIIDVVLSTNANRTKIISLINTIDQDHDGAVSDAELTTNLMKARKGGFATADLGLVQAILNKNSNYNNVQSIINIFDPDQNGSITDIEMFLGLMAEHNSANAATFLPAVVDVLKTLNTNSAAIEALVNSIDPNNSGTVDYDELISAYLKINAGTMADVSTEIKRILPGLNGVAYGDKAITAETLLDSVDADHNGQVSDIEIANILIANRKNNVLGSYDAGLLAAIFKTNPNKAAIDILINQIGGIDGEFTDAEVTQVLLAQFKNPNLYGANTSLVETILSTHNSSYAHIKDLIGSVDSDHDGVISNLEAMKSIVNDAKGLITAADKPIVDSILGSNTNLTAIKTAYTNFAINPNSSTLTQDLFGIWIDIQQGVRTGTYFTELVSALGKTSDLNTLTTQFTSLDSNHDGKINETEFGDLLVDIMKGTKTAASYQTIINYLLHDPKLAAVKGIVDSFGNRSDQGILTGLLQLWKPGQQSLLSANFIQSILALNPHSTTIQKILTLVDPTKTGVINNNTTMSYIYSLQVARYSSPQTEMKYDFNNDGVIDQKDFDNYTSFYQYITNSSGGTSFTIK